MLPQAPLLLHLTSSFLIATLRLHIEPENPVEHHGDESQTPVILISPNRNISLTLKGANLLADGRPFSGTHGVWSLNESQFSLTARCQSGFGFKLSADDADRTFTSPSFCANHGLNKLLIGPDDRGDEIFYGCVRNVTLGLNQILDLWCRFKTDASQRRSTPTGLVNTTTATLLNLPLRQEPLFVGEPLQCYEGGSSRIQWKNIYLFPEHRHFRLAYEDVQLTVTNPPEHGQLLLGEHPVNEFTYREIINQNITYRHDGSESSDDSVDFQVLVTNGAPTASPVPPWMLSLPVKVDPVDDRTHLRVTEAGQHINVAPSARVPLGAHYLEFFDVDTPTNEVWVDVVRQKGAHLSTSAGKLLKSFSLAQFLQGNVFIEPDDEQGEVLLSTRGSEDDEVVLRVVSAPVEFQLISNTGLHMPYRSSRLISAGNLTFTASFPVPLSYTVVDNAEYGVVECLRPVHSGGGEDFQLCSQFTQLDLERFRVRYRHSADNRPLRDSFAFRVFHGQQQSELFEFTIEFFPTSVRVYSQQSIVLNNSEQLLISRAHLLATSFPDQVEPDDLIYHIVEPPKFGMISRQVGSKMRRIGLASNFTQAHIDDGTVTYRLNYVQYNVLNDFFMYRILSPSTTTELLRCEITFLPGGSSLQLVNRTLVLTEGQSQKITNNTLWLETPDEDSFTFTLLVPPSEGRLVLVNPYSIREFLDLGGTFTSLDILARKLSYEHSDSESTIDQFFLRAQSVHQPGMRFSFWLHVRIIPADDHAPLLRGPYAARHNQLSISVLEGGERVLYESLLPWADPDSRAGTLHFFFPQLFRDFTVSHRADPELPVRNFTDGDLRQQTLLIRHVSVKSKASLAYVVGDDVHSVQARINFVAEKLPFLRILYGKVPTVQPITSRSVILVTVLNLWAETNIDMDPEAITMVIQDGDRSPFFVLSIEGKMEKAVRFTQKSISDSRVFMRPFFEPQLVEIVAEAQNLQTPFRLSVEPQYNTIPFQLHLIDHVQLPRAAVFDFDNTILQMAGHNDNTARVRVHRRPEQGSLAMEFGNRKAEGVVSVEVSTFRKRELDEAAVRYIHNGLLKTGGDYLLLNISVDRFQLIGPLRVDFEVVDQGQPVIVVLRNLSLPWGESVSLNGSHIRALIPGSTGEHVHALRVEVVQLPSVGRILVDGQEIRDNTLAFFSADQLYAGRVLFTASPGTHFTAPLDTYAELRACQRTCSLPARLHIHIQADNIQSPELLRNEPLTTADRPALITPRHLHAADPDTDAHHLRYLVWEPTGGHVVRLDDPNRTSLTGFSQADVDRRYIAFVTDEPVVQGRLGFSFLLTDGVHQSGAEWFAVEPSTNREVSLETNVRLNVAPGSKIDVGPDVLKARITKVPSSDVIYQISRPPVHGRLQLKEQEGPVHNFTQADIDEHRLIFVSHSEELGSWLIRDFFSFIVFTRGEQAYTATAVPRQDNFRFRLLISYAFVSDADLHKFVNRSALTVTKGGHLSVNTTYLSLRPLEQYCNDVLFVQLLRAPRQGQLEFLGQQEASPDGDLYEATEDAVERANIITADQLHSGRHLVYRQTGNAVGPTDEFVLSVYALREKTRRADKLRVPMTVNITGFSNDVEIKRFRTELTVLSGGSTVLSPVDYLAANLAYPNAPVIYHVQQAGSNGVTVRLNGSVATISEFTQTELDAGLVRLEHAPLSAEDKFDLLTLRLGGALTRLLFVRVEPLALELFNHTDITYMQGETYVVLTREHLGTVANVPASRVTYNITEPPVNGSLYWVAGETTATVFTQKNIDEGDILYAQLNMNAFEDRFRFVCSNDDIELLPKTGRVRVQAAVRVQPLQAQPMSITQVAETHLNASGMRGRAPRYLVVEPPRFGRFFIYPHANDTITFFTQSNVQNGRLFYQTYERDGPAIDRTLLELRSDDVQPARFNWTVLIAPDGEQIAENGAKRPAIMVKTGAGSGLPAGVDLNYRFPLGIIATIVLGVIAFLACRKSSGDDGKRHSTADAIPNIGTRDLPPEPDEENEQETRKRHKASAILQPDQARSGNDLLEQTVYVDSRRRSGRAPLQQDSVQVARKLTTFQQSPAKLPPPHGPAYRSTALAAVVKAQLDEKNSGKRSRLNENQFWV